MILIDALCAGILALGIGTGGTANNIEYACTHVPQIVETSIRLDLRPEVVIALIHYESRWTPTAVSHAGACGLTQVLPKYTGGRAYPRGTGVPKLTCDQLKDAKTSINAGMHTLRYWHHRYARGNELIALCGYNAGFRCKGPNAVPKGVRYATRVKRLADKLRRYVDARLSRDN